MSKQSDVRLMVNVYSYTATGADKEKAFAEFETDSGPTSARYDHGLDR